MILEELKSGHTNGWKTQFIIGALSNRQLGPCIESVLDVSLLSIFINDKEWNRQCIYYLANDTKARRSYKHF